MKVNYHNKSFSWEYFAGVLFWAIAFLFIFLKWNFSNFPWFQKDLKRCSLSEMVTHKNDNKNVLRIKQLYRQPWFLLVLFKYGMTMPEFLPYFQMFNFDLYAYLASYNGFVDINFTTVLICIFQMDLAFSTLVGHLLFWKIHSNLKIWKFDCFWLC